MSTNPLVSVILLNWNSGELTVQCLRQLRRLCYSPLECIVADNGSTDGSPDRLRNEYPGVKVVANKSNLGFCGGNNAAIREACGRYLLLLNTDTVLAPDFLQPLIDRAEADPHAGALSPKILYVDPPGVIQYAGGGRMNMITGRHFWRGNGEKDHGQYDITRQTTFAHGAAFLVRRSVVDRVGALDPSYFAYYEELDWSLRIRSAGYHILYVPQAVLGHYASFTVKRTHPIRSYLVTRNRIRFHLQHGRWWQRPLFGLYILMISLPVHLFRMIITGKRREINALIAGTVDGITNRGGTPRRTL